MASSSSALSSLSSRLQTPTGKVALVAVATTAITAATLLSSQAILRKSRRRRLRDSVERKFVHGAVQDAEGDDEGEEEEEMIDFTRSVRDEQGARREGKKASPSQQPVGAAKSRKPTSEVIIRESLARNYVFFGEEGMHKIRGAFVVIVGLGGVGSAAATMLVRSGVRKVRLIDFDQVSLSSLNVRVLLLPCHSPSNTELNPPLSGPLHSATPPPPSPK